MNWTGCFTCYSNEVPLHFRVAVVFFSPQKQSTTCGSDSRTLNSMWSNGLIVCCNTRLSTSSKGCNSLCTIQSCMHCIMFDGQHAAVCISILLCLIVNTQRYVFLFYYVWWSTRSGMYFYFIMFDCQHAAVCISPSPRLSCSFTLLCTFKNVLPKLIFVSVQSRCLFNQV